MHARPLNIALALVLAVNFLHLPSSYAIESSEQAKLIYTLKNSETPLGERKSAITELAKNPDDESRSVFIDILQDQKESRIIHQHIAATVTRTNDLAFLNLLKTKLADKKTDAYLREVSLSILWKHNSESILPVILAIAKDPFETNTFRGIIFRYLAPMSKKTEVKDMMANIIKDSEESAEIKKLAFNVLNRSGDQGALLGTFQDMVFDHERSTKERIEALEMIETKRSSSLEKILLTILENKTESLEMKQVAFQKMSSNKRRFEAALPELKRLERLGPLVGISSPLREEMRDLIESTERTLKTTSNEETGIPGSAPSP